MTNAQIQNVESFISAVKKAYLSWDTQASPWFRGEPESKTPLLPKLYRPRPDGKKLIENRLIQSFRRMAPSLSQHQTPDKHAIDEWLFFMQHLRLPTRLLDWTEGALIGLYFALQCDQPVVWMLDPYRLNRLSSSHDFPPDAFPLTWFRPKDGTVNIGHENIRGAWETDKKGVDLPVAIKPTYIHSRMSAQKSCITVHGKKKDSIVDLVPEDILVKFDIDETFKEDLISELKMLGLTRTTLFPEVEHLAIELEEIAIKLDESDF